jgi:hypothetical protein
MSGCGMSDIGAFRLLVSPFTKPVTDAVFRKTLTSI